MSQVPKLKRSTFTITALKKQPDVTHNAMTAQIIASVFDLKSVSMHPTPVNRLLRTEQGANVETYIYRAKVSHNRKLYFALLPMFQGYILRCQVWLFRAQSNTLPPSSSSF
jgi:hypothetical protein